MDTMLTTNINQVTKKKYKHANEPSYENVAMLKSWTSIAVTLTSIGMILSTGLEPAISGLEVPRVVQLRHESKSSSARY